VLLSCSAMNDKWKVLQVLRTSSLFSLISYSSELLRTITLVLSFYVNFLMFLTMKKIPNGDQHYKNVCTKILYYSQVLMTHLILFNITRLQIIFIVSTFYFLFAAQSFCCFHYIKLHQCATIKTKSNRER